MASTRPLELVGKRFGRLLVIEKSAQKGKGTYWKCLCDCGNEVVVYGYSLNKGSTRSCGCLNKDRIKQMNIEGATHGMSRDRLYRIYYGMKNRCYRKDTNRYENYGGRGIEVCSEWLNDFEAFAKWAFQNGYREDLTLDRIDNSKGYEPNNCRWATKKEQVLNSSQAKLYTYEGKTLCVADWASEKGISRAALYQRLKRGIPFEVAIEMPYHRRGRHKESK